MDSERITGYSETDPLPTIVPPRNGGFLRCERNCVYFTIQDLSPSGNEQMKLHNHVALVTGAGTGIGRAIAERFAREGARVAVNYRRSQKEAEEVVAGIRSKGGTALAIQADVSQEAAVVALVRRIEQEWGRLDFLVNNAAWTTPIPHEKLDALNDEIWDHTFESNLRAPFYCVRAAVPLLRRNPGASVVNITSVAGINGLGSSIGFWAAEAGPGWLEGSMGPALA